ncbi:MAG: hypothetical protein MUE70_16665 [Desulfobacterales bacterium]|nr:hypothetical protein [Desulfobacterales bacterium]
MNRLGGSYSMLPDLPVEVTESSACKPERCLCCHAIEGRGPVGPARPSCAYIAGRFRSVA